MKSSLLLSLILLCLFSLSSTSPATDAAQTTRELRVVSANAAPGQAVNVSVELVAQGNENALGFSLTFNQALLSNPQVTLGSGAPNASLNANTGQAASGRVGALLALPSNQAFAAGVRQVVVVRFDVAANAALGPTTIGFGDQPIAREVSDVNAGVLTTTYTPGTLTIATVQQNPVPALSSLNPATRQAGSGAFTLTVSGSNFIAGSVVRWNGSDRATTFSSATQLTAAILAADVAGASTATVTVFNPAPGGGASNALTFTITAPPNPVPALTSLEPNTKVAGSAAFTLTVNGTNFVNGARVRWNGQERTTNFVNVAQLLAEIPAADVAAPGNVNVTVSNPASSGGGGGVSNALIFAITGQPNPAPVISGLNPNFAAAGGAAFALTVNGSNFVSGAVVRWNGTDRQTSFVSAAQLTAAITAADIASAGTAAVTVFNPAPGGGLSNSVNFTIGQQSNPAPVLTSLNPSTRVAGGGAFTLTVNGTGFISSSKVHWNGQERATTFGSATQLTAAILAGETANQGAASVTVVTPAPGGGTSAALTFTITPPQANPAPTITSLSPSAATAGGAAFTLTVSGANFINGSLVRWNGADRQTTFVSATQLTAAIPATDSASAGTAAITVFNPAPGGGVSNTLNFTINPQSNPTPVLTSLSPGSATAGGAAFTLTVNGANFVTGATVRWNNNDRTTTFVSATQLTAAIPAADIANAGTASITVANPTPGGGASNALIFTISQQPTAQVTVAPANPTTNDEVTIQVSGTWPNSCVPRDPQLTIVGNELRINTVNIAPACAQVLTNYNFSVTVGRLAGGNYVARVLHTAFNEQREIGRANFVVTLPAPTISSISPAIAAAGGAAFNLTVNGANFTFGSVVRWNGADRPTTLVNATQLRAEIPATDLAAIGTAAITVFAPAPVNAVSNAITFTIASPLASVSAASFAGAELSAEAVVAAFGAGLATGTEAARVTPLPTTLQGTTVRVRDSAGLERLAPLFFVAPGQLNYQMPAGTASGPATVTVTSGDGKLSFGTVQIASVAPGIFAANANGQGVAAGFVVRVRTNGMQVFEPIAVLGANRTYTPLAIDLGPEGEQVFLVLYGTGFRQRSSLSTVGAAIGGVNASVNFAGPQGVFVGLDQINARLPRSLIGRGEVDVMLTVEGKAANTVRISIK